MLYGYKDGKKGIEAEYWAVDTRLNIKISGADHWTDFAQCLFAWPRKRTEYGKFHRYFWKLANELNDEIRRNVNWSSINFISIRGFSLGGAVGGILSLLMGDKIIDCRTVNSPKNGNKEAQESQDIMELVQHYHNKGDIVRHLPLIYPKQIDSSEYANTRPFWKAHNNLPNWWTLFREELTKLPIYDKMTSLMNKE